jgi:hypothetical protein
MTGPIVVGFVYSLIVIVLSVLKPNAGRIVLGIFFLAMGLGVNLTMALIGRIIGSAPLLFGILLIGFEAE